MDIGVPIRELGEVDSSALRDAILAQEEAAWHEDEYRQQTYDVHLLPVLQSPPIKLGEQAPDVAFETLLERVSAYSSYTPPYNAAGAPAMSVPLLPLQLQNKNKLQTQQK